MSCDIIIPVWNQLQYTKCCLDSLFEFTHLPFRLIIIDNASDIATAQYLDSVKEKNPEQVILIRNKGNLGFVKAVNQGIKKSSAPYICLLNNDTLVTPGWLEQMIKVAESRNEIGIVNPSSNTLGFFPKRGQTIESFAQDLKNFSGKYSELAWASGFCMLIKREVMEKIGLFDEIFGMGTFEDADFSKRAQKLGYLCVGTRAGYVYHRERRSFIKHKMFERNFDRNRQIFFSRWGKQKRLLYVLTQNRPENLARFHEESLKLARQGDVVWLFLKDKNVEELKSHSNIYVYNIPRGLFSLVSLWRIVKRKKKFDVIYVDDEGYGKRLNLFKIFHKAEVIYAG